MLCRLCTAVVRAVSWREHDRNTLPREEGVHLDMNRFVFLGAPGVGKGSFTSILAPQLVRTENIIGGGASSNTSENHVWVSPGCPAYFHTRCLLPPLQGLATVGVGDLVRDEVTQGTAAGKELKVRNVNSSVKCCHPAQPCSATTTTFPLRAKTWRAFSVWLGGRLALLLVPSPTESGIDQ